MIQGLSETIAEHMPVIMIEFNPRSYDKIKEYIKEKQFGYETMSYNEKDDTFRPFDQNNPDLNVFFIPVSQA